jgi:hypothetical protein
LTLFLASESEAGDYCVNVILFENRRNGIWGGIVDVQDDDFRSGGEEVGRLI